MKNNFGFVSIVVEPVLDCASIDVLTDAGQRRRRLAMTPATVTGELTMIAKTSKATAKTAYGVKIAPLTYSFGWNEFTTKDEAVSLDKWPSDDDILKRLNEDAKANASSTERNKAFELAGFVKPTAENSDDIRIKDMVKTMLTSKLPNGQPRFTPEQARKIAADTLGIELTEESAE